MTPEVSQEQITVSESECYEITHIREKSGFAAGVLVAISIPIFTSQLKKARLATNQANARAAYAAATTQYMLDYSDTQPSGNVSYKYTVSKGTAEADKTAATLDLTTTDISSWTITTQSVKTNLGDKTADTWDVVLNSNGEVQGYLATFPTK